MLCTYSKYSGTVTDEENKTMKNMSETAIVTIFDVFFYNFFSIRVDICSFFARISGFVWLRFDT